MSTIEPLILDLVEWIAKEPRSYDHVMDVWRSSCPRLTVWEDAVDRDLVRRDATTGAGFVVLVTQRGRELPQQHGRLPLQHV